jgi:hypothetical protein
MNRASSAGRTTSGVSSSAPHPLPGHPHQMAARIRASESAISLQPMTVGTCSHRSIARPASSSTPTLSSTDNAMTGACISARTRHPVFDRRRGASAASGIGSNRPPSPRDQRTRKFEAGVDRS